MNCWVFRWGGSSVATLTALYTFRTLPKKLLIVGGGVVGCEFACMMQAFGVEVTIVELLPSLIPMEDEDASKELRKQFERRGIAVSLPT